MTLYAIFEPRFGRTDAPQAVPEKFDWLAAILPPIFFMRHALWLELVGFLVFAGVLVFAAGWLGPEAVKWIYLLSAIWLGLSASALRRAALKRAGWRHRAELIAASPDTARLVWLRFGRP